MDIEGTPFCVDDGIRRFVDELSRRVAALRSGGHLTPDVLVQIRRFFRIKNIYHSNAIEGNSLDIGETRQVVELGLTLTGKPLRDQAEAKNLAEALDYLEELATDLTIPLTEVHIRQLHKFVLKGINDDEAGKYRSVEVAISGSDYEPTSPESVNSTMHEFGEWLKSASVKPFPLGSDTALLNAVAAHTLFVQIHPFIDGNGRVARLLMNLLLMRNGFPISIIAREDRYRYYEALEISQTSDLTPLLSLVIECIQEGLEEYESAIERKQDEVDWADALAARFEQPERTRIANEYEVWKSAMELVRARFRQMSETLLDSFTVGHIYFKDFGHIAHEKYVVLRAGESAKKTWFFRIDIVKGRKSARYLFFFISQSRVMRENGCLVTIRLAKENPVDSFNYEWLEHIGGIWTPDILEIGYHMKKEIFAYRNRKKNDSVVIATIDIIARDFFAQVIQNDFT